MAGDWEYEEYEESEPYEAEPYEAADAWEAADDEAESEYDGEAIVRDQRRPAAPPPPPFRGVQTATVTTPRGTATIKLPSKVPTLGELTRVQRELATTKRRMGELSVDMRRSRRASRSRARSDDHGARNTVLILALESVRDVLRDVGTYSLISDLSH